MRDTASAQCQAAERLEAAERAIREHALEYLPSLSALLGPLLAAKLSVIAHGRARLARLPSSTLQVLGAEKAFFSHLRSGTPVPKHGMIFQHPWISRSPRWIRGKVSRMLAGKATIAVRVDHFGGKAWGAAEVATVEQAVAAIRKRHPSPSKKRQDKKR
jgi:nucleolar protein 56